MGETVGFGLCAFAWPRAPEPHKLPVGDVVRMKCDKCDKEAVVHEIVPSGGKLVEKHLCVEHAGEAGIETSHQQIPVHELFKIALAPVGAPSRQILACRNCGMSYSEFQKAGLLGCRDCYRAFEARLGPLLERAHEGAVHHVGKVPQRALSSHREESQGDHPTPLPAPDRARLLRARLEQAVRKEDYEQAAKLRDELSELSSNGGEEGGGASA